ncbi:uncharacterized protein LOC116220579 [Clupea harengus]|uniref:Uncharacterized protein LOC116220579 n=1 Tax=Clupea harengus TaxID=7950 RepID=A0A8M1KID1_CLUHA|nr:uncharacterized protein LOC116220579 [Clupea harengus]
MSSKTSEQSLLTEESRPVDEDAATNKEPTIWKADPVSTPSVTKVVEWEDKKESRGIAAALGLPISQEEDFASLGVGNVEELASLSTDQPLSDVQMEAFKAFYKQERKSKSEGQQSLVPPVVLGAASVEDSTAWGDDDEEDFQNFLSFLTDNSKLSACLKGEAVAESDKGFYETLHRILHAENIPSSLQKEIERYYHLKTRHILSFEEQQVISYYAKGANLSGLPSSQLWKYMLPNGPQGISPYSKRPSLNTRPARKFTTAPKIQHIKSNKSNRTMEIEDRIRQLTLKREGMETNARITPVKIKVHLKVKNREELTYDNINQIRRKADEGSNLYLHTLTQCKKWDTLQSWGCLHRFYPTLSDCVNFPEVFSTYSWSWSGRKNMVEIWELGKNKGAAAPPSFPASSALPKST